MIYKSQSLRRLLQSAKPIARYNLSHNRAVEIVRNTSGLYTLYDYIAYTHENGEKYCYTPIAIQYDKMHKQHYFIYLNTLIWITGGEIL